MQVFFAFHVVDRLTCFPSLARGLISASGAHASASCWSPGARSESGFWGEEAAGMDVLLVLVLRC